MNGSQDRKGTLSDKLISDLQEFLHDFRAKLLVFTIFLKMYVCIFMFSVIFEENYFINHVCCPLRQSSSKKRLSFKKKSQFYELTPLRMEVK